MKDGEEIIATPICTGWLDGKAEFGYAESSVRQLIAAARLQGTEEERKRIIEANVLEIEKCNQHIAELERLRAVFCNLAVSLEGKYIVNKDTLEAIDAARAALGFKK